MPSSRSARRARGAGRGRVLTVWLTLGLLVLTVSAFGILTQVLPRTFSAAQQQQIITWEMSKRWRDWPAGKVFPARIGYKIPGSLLDSSQGLALHAHRIGIAHAASCHFAVDQAIARVLAAHGCRQVLRATYGDATGALLVTVGVVVMPDLGAALASSHAFPAGPSAHPGLRVARFGQTLAAGFSNADRQVAWRLVAGPYIVIATAGYAGGKPHMPVGKDPYVQGEMLSLAGGVGSVIASSIGAQPPPPRCPGVPGC